MSRIRLMRDFFMRTGADPVTPGPLPIPASLRRPRYSRQNTCSTCLWYRESPEAKGIGGRCMVNPPTAFIIEVPMRAAAVALPGHRNGAGQTIMQKQSIGGLPTVAAGDYCSKHRPVPKDETAAPPAPMV